MEKKVQIVAAGAPASRSQSQAVRFENLVYISGQTGRDPGTGALAEGVDAQTRQMLANIDAILAAAACNRKDLVTVTLIFSDLEDFEEVDRIYAEWHPPGETTAGCNTFVSKKLPGGALVQIDAVAAIP